jgi:glycerol kinase
MKLIASSKEVGQLAKLANPEDQTCLVPAFSGMGAPYWCGEAQAMLCGMTRRTGKNEIAKAAEEAIGYQLRTF